MLPFKFRFIISRENEYNQYLVEFAASQLDIVNL